MKSAPKRKPFDHVQPQLGPERIQRMWSVVEQAQRKPYRKQQRLALMACAAVLLLSGLGTLLRSGNRQEVSPLAQQGAVLVGDQHVTSMALPDGSQLVLDQRAKLQIVEANNAATRVRLLRGKATFDVKPRAQQSFVVEAHEMTVQVRGTRFSVSLDSNEVGSVTVHVEKGKVEIVGVREERVATLIAGQSWSRAAPTAESESAGTDASTPIVAPEANAHDAVKQRVSNPNRHDTMGAAELFERANEQRVAGRPEQAALDYERLRTRFPRDARAGLAAFELGRIRLDSLHDPRGALSALRFALGHQSGGFAAEDARALQIDALARLGDSAACSAARQAFLTSYPHSAHKKRVLGACPDE